MAGVTEKNPPRCQSRMRAKTDGASKRGQASQSIDPAREISAADRVQPMIA